MSASVPNIIYGAAGAAQLSPEELTRRLTILRDHNVNKLDSAYIYPGSEQALGRNDTAKQFFEIHTKAPALQPGTLSKQSILDGVTKSLNDLQTSQIELYYFHGPDAATPLEESLSAIQEIYAAGKIKRFGLSNFSPEDVQKVHDIQAKAKSVLPTVYQGNYNAVARHIEDDLFPLLRKLHIQYFAYSPIAGGFLVKDAEGLRTGNVEGRFSGKTPIGDLYNSLYCKESMFEALDEWGHIANDAGITKAALAYRWVSFHSAIKAENGDGIIIGASKDSQLEETLKAIEAGPLETRTADRASGIWAGVKKDAPRDNWNDYFALKQ